MNALETVRLQIANIPECVALAQANFADFESRPEAVAKWFEARVSRNPWQASLEGIGVGIRDAHGLVAFRVMFAQPWWLEQRETVVAFAAHTAVDDRYRGQGLGTRLIEESRSFARLTGSATAGNATQKIYPRLGFAAIGGQDNGFFQCRVSFEGSLRRRIGARGARPLGRLLDLRLDRRVRQRDATPGQLAPLSRCDGEVDTLWAQVREQEVSCLQRDARYLNWRLFDEPTCALSLGAFRDRRGVLRAVCVWAEIDYAQGVRCAVLRDVVVPRSDGAAQHGLLITLLRHWRETGYTWARFEVSSAPLERLYRSMGFDPVASHGNRYWIHADPPLPTQVKDDWFRSGLDGDYFDFG